jgi:hypothetical protein
VHQARLADARNAFEQHVAAGEQADHRSLDDLLVADDAAAHLIGDAGETLAELLD